MENYYDKIIAEIRTAIDDKKYGEAEYLLQRELKMPYIPEDAEKKLLAGFSPGEKKEFRRLLTKAIANFS